MLYKRSFGLDLMRVIACLMVIEIHGRQINSGSYKGLGYETDPLNIFFILSGFLIGIILIRDFVKVRFTIFRLMNFWLRRIFKILPLYFIYLFIQILFMKFRHQEIQDLREYIFLVQNLTTPLPSVDFFPESWSLTIEFWFYLCSPLLIGAVQLFPRHLKKIGYVVLFISIITLSVYLRYHSFSENFIFSSEEWKEHIRTPFICRLDAMLFGILASVIYTYKNQIWRNKKFFMSIGFFGIALSIIFDQSFILKGFYGFGSFSCIWYFVVVGLSYSMVLPFLDSFRPPSLFCYKVMSYLSKSTYCIYLAHSLMRLQIIPALQSFLNLSGIESLLIYWIGSIILGIFSYEKIEKKVMDIRNNLLPQGSINFRQVNI